MRDRNDKSDKPDKSEESWSLTPARACCWLRAHSLCASLHKGRDEAAKAPHATSLSLARTLCPFQSALQQCGDLSSAWCSKGTQHRPS